MNRLREKTTATLLIAILMTSTLTAAITVMAVGPVHNITKDLYYSTIQAAVDWATPFDTIIVSAGTYDEQVVIGNSMTIIGAGDTTVIQPSGGGVLTTVKTSPWLNGGSKPMAAIVFVHTTGGNVTLKNLKIDGSLITTRPSGIGGNDWVSGLAYLESHGIIEGLTVVGNPSLSCRTAGIWASAISDTSYVEVKGCTVIGYNRAGIYALGEELTADYHHNEINGPGAHTSQVPNGMFFLEGATGSATYNTVTDLGYTGETYRSTGIGTFRPGPNLVFGHNEIYNVQNAFAIAGGSGATIEYNYIHDCHTGVKLEAITYWTPYDRARNVMIQYNDIMNNAFAIRSGGEMGEGNEAHYNNFVGNLGTEWTWSEETYDAAVCNVHEENTFDATLNWWGHASGPSGEFGRVNKAGKVIGKGDSVSDNVDWDQWLPQPVFHTPHHPVPPGLRNKK